MQFINFMLEYFFLNINNYEYIINSILIFLFYSSGFKERKLLSLFLIRSIDLLNYIHIKFIYSEYLIV